MTVTFEIAQLISFFVVTIEITKSNDMVNVKSFPKNRLGDSATPAGMIISGAGTAGLALPIRPVVIGVTTAPGMVTCSIPVMRFPFSEALMIAVENTICSFDFPLRSFNGFAAPIAIYLLLIVSGIVLASCACACKRAAIWAFTNVKLVADQLTMMATVGLDFRGFNNLDFAAPLANLLNPMGIIVAFLAAKRLSLSEWLKSSTTLNTGFKRQNFSHTVIVARLFGYVKQCGSGTVGAVARELGRRFIGIDLSARYLTENALPRSERLTSSKSLEQLPMFSKPA